MKRFNVCIKRTYTTKQGEEKTSWPRIGVAFEGDKGISGIIEMIPAGSWDGRFVLFDAEDQGQQPQRQAPAQNRAPAPTQAGDEFNDDIPF
jgi:hypothetical protein